MGFSEDHSDHNRKWVIAGISLRAPLNPIYTAKRVDHHRHKHRQQQEEGEEEEEEEECSRTPTGEDSKVPATLACPPAPRKRKQSLKCNGSAREFFTPPDLETVFIRRHVERAN